jgi:hypothetical protein
VRTVHANRHADGGVAAQDWVANHVGHYWFGTARYVIVIVGKGKSVQPRQHRRFQPSRYGRKKFIEKDLTTAHHGVFRSTTIAIMDQQPRDTPFILVRRVNDGWVSTTILSSKKEINKRIHIDEDVPLLLY